MPPKRTKPPYVVVKLTREDEPDTGRRDRRNHHEKTRSISYKYLVKCATLQYKGKYDANLAAYEAEKDSLAVHTQYNSFPPQFLSYFQDKSEQVMKPFDWNHCAKINDYRSNATNQHPMMSNVFPLSDLSILTNNKKFLALTTQVCASIPVLEDSTSTAATEDKRYTRQRTTDNANVPIAYLVVTVVPNTDEYFHINHVRERNREKRFFDPFFASTLALFDASFPSEENHTNSQGHHGCGLILQGLHRTITLQVYIRQNVKSTSANSPAVGVVSALSFRFDEEEEPTEERDIRSTAYMVLLASAVPVYDEEGYNEKGLATTLMKLASVGAASLTEYAFVGGEREKLREDFQFGVNCHEKDSSDIVLHCLIALAMWYWRKGGLVVPTAAYQETQKNNTEDPTRIAAGITKIMDTLPYPKMDTFVAIVIKGTKIRVYMNTTRKCESFVRLLDKFVVASENAEDPCVTIAPYLPSFWPFFRDFSHVAHPQIELYTEEYEGIYASDFHADNRVLLLALSPKSSSNMLTHLFREGMIEETDDQKTRREILVAREDSDSLARSIETNVEYVSNIFEETRVEVLEVILRDPILINYEKKRYFEFLSKAACPPMYDIWPVTPEPKLVFYNVPNKKNLCEWDQMNKSDFQNPKVKFWIRRKSTPGLETGPASVARARRAKPAGKRKSPSVAAAQHAPKKRQNTQVSIAAPPPEDERSRFQLFLLLRKRGRKTKREI